MKNTKTIIGRWEALSGYIPVLFMLMFAMLTYWLLQITPKAITKENRPPPSHEEDYFMKDFSLRMFEKNGEIKTYIMGNYARHFPDTDTIEINEPKIYTQTNNRPNNTQKTEGSARIATSNAEATLIELKGKVVLLKQDVSGKEAPVITRISGEYLKINSDTEQISSSEPVEIEKGLQKIYANSMSYDNLDRHLKMSGNVRVIFAKN
jgi:lipopolysaccharide export system protein LptC